MDAHDTVRDMLKHTTVSITDMSLHQLASQHVHLLGLSVKPKPRPLF